MSPLLCLLAGAACGLGLGGLLGWLLGQRQRSPAAPPDGRLEAELREQVRRHAEELTREREKLAAAEIARAGAEARHTAGEQQLAEQRRAQERALLEMREAFQTLSAEALRRTQPEFLQLAGETLGRFQEIAKGDLAQRQQAIATLLAPLQAQLETYQQRLQQSEAGQSAALGEVRQHLAALALESQSLAGETAQLRRVLGSNQARGRWGEETLRRVVEAAGLSPHCDFREQTVAGDSKPDLVVHLPGNRLILVDAKVPDLDFLHALDTAEPAARTAALAAHAAKLRDTIRALAARDYPRAFPEALDQVVLFLPAESLFSAALEADRELIVWAAERHIMLATPASLIALLRAVSLSWRQHAQSENAREIAAAAQELFTRVARFTEHLDKIRDGLQKAGAAYNDAVGSYERMVRPAGEKVARLSGGAAGRDLAELAPLAAVLRPPPAP